VVRDVARWRATGLSATARIADLGDPAALASTLTGADVVVSCAHALHSPAIIAAAPLEARLVLLGSTRRHSRWADAHGDGVRAGEAAFLVSGRRGAMLHPTMIYGAEGEDNVQRLAALMRRLPVAPLPGGGRALVQPIYQQDVTRCLVAAVDHDWETAVSMVIAGPRPLRYAAFLRAVCAAAGLRAPWIVPMPLEPLLAIVPLLSGIPGLPRIEGAELRRLTEDKSFDIGPMRTQLGVEPIPLEEGLARTFNSQVEAARLSEQPRRFDSASAAGFKLPRGAAD
jgi:uncharacterized protein YbjT (DUF2867 family)